MHCAIVSTEALDAAAPEPLSREEAHHLRDVLRAKPGDAVVLCDGTGRTRVAVVGELSRHGVAFRDFGPVITQPPPPARITLFACIAKPARMDWLLEKACELGVEKIVPVLSERVVARQAPGEVPARWLRILDSALRQSGGGLATALAPVATWNEALAMAADLGGPLFVGSLAPGAIALGEALLARRDALRTSRTGWLVGPEGDFSPNELAGALALPCAVPVTLGTRVLRVETAAVCGISAMLALSLR